MRKKPKHRNNLFNGDIIFIGFCGFQNILSKKPFTLQHRRNQKTNYKRVCGQEYSRNHDQ